jgi:para-aminobenzoate synthetase/4-amino-4-deoxychorismate lyase
MSAPPHADPGRGVFETTLVLEGRPVELEAHLERISASLATLYDAELPAGLREAVLERARALRIGRLRFAIAPTATGPKIAIDAEEIDPAVVFPTAARAVHLRRTTVVGGLGEHKWADRHLLERTEARSLGELPLLVDGDGAVLEAARGSVFTARGGSLRTPPTDGRILLSIARRQVIEVASAAGVEVEEVPLTRGDLLRADEVFLAGSLRGVEPVGAVDGRALPEAGEITRRVGDDLRRRWWWAPAAAPAAAVAGGRPGDPPGR